MSRRCRWGGEVCRRPPRPPVSFGRGPGSADGRRTPAALDATSSTARGPQGANIRFQFDGIPYQDVLERFAQMANKPLVADTNLQGTLTFNDPKAYSYQEALDTLNLMLSMKDMTLVESDHYLRLVPLKQLPQMPIENLRGLDKTGRYPAWRNCHGPSRGEKPRRQRSIRSGHLDAVQCGFGGAHVARARRHYHGSTGRTSSGSAAC